MLKENVFDEIRELPIKNELRMELESVGKKLSKKEISEEEAFAIKAQLQTSYMSNKERIRKDVIRNEKIIIVDAIMGSGKSTFMIDEIINKNPDRRFLIVVPTVNDKVNGKGEVTYKSEVTRYKEAVVSYLFEPFTSNGGDENACPSKQCSLQNAIAQGKSIITSHSLIRMADETTMALLRESNYTLIIDESLSVVCDYNKFCERNKVTKDDIKSLIQDCWITINQDGYFEWNDLKDVAEYNGRYEGVWSKIKTLCKLHSLMYLRKKDGSFSNEIIIWNMPVQFFSLFEKTFICTYLWNGSHQKAYFDMNEIRYAHMMLYNHKLIVYDRTQEIMQRKAVYKLIKVYQDGDFPRRLNRIGTSDKENDSLLSKAWYERKRKSDPGSLVTLRKNTESYFKNGTETKAHVNMYTTFKTYTKHVKGDRYTRGFVPCNAKATNEFKHKKSLAYLINLYSEPNIVNFFRQHGVFFNQELYAVSELLQWIWRSAIREGQPINLYLPSDRMRRLLNEWALGAI